jgi:hypothetical protein
MTPERLAAMQEGRQRWEAEERQRKFRHSQDFSEWVQEDARLWRLYQATDGRRTPEGQVAYDHWSANLRDMPGLA